MATPNFSESLFTENNDDDEDEIITSSQMLMKLEEAWRNEKFCPELLHYQHDIVHCVLEQIKQMEENIQRSKKIDFRSTVHKMELDRIKFVLTSYLRNRIEKIEKCAASIVEETERQDDDVVDSMLSPEEYRFAKEYLKSLDTHLSTVAANQMPHNLQYIDLNKNMPKPNMDAFVFLKANEQITGVLVDDEGDADRDDTVDLEKDSQHIMRYRPIANFVKQGTVTLI
ncbi:GINS4 (predicted) [Pycnogonum litorale]